MTDRRRAAARRMRQIAATLRARSKLGREESSRAIARVTGELAVLAEKTAAQAAAVARNGRRAVPRSGSRTLAWLARRVLTFRGIHSAGWCLKLQFRLSRLGACPR